MNLFNLILDLALPIVVIGGILTIMHTLDKIHQDLQTLIHLQWESNQKARPALDSRPNAG